MCAVPWVSTRNTWLFRPPPSAFMRRGCWPRWHLTMRLTIASSRMSGHRVRDRQQHLAEGRRVGQAHRVVAALEADVLVAHDGGQPHLVQEGIGFGIARTDAVGQ